MTFSDTEMKKLGRSTQISIHNTRSLICISQVCRKKPSRWMNVNTHAHTGVPKIHKKSSKFLLNFSEFCNSDTSRGDCFTSVFLEIFRECFWNLGLKFLLKKRFLEIKGMRPLHCKFSLKNFCNEFAEMYEINDIQKTNH